MGGGLRGRLLGVLLLLRGKSERFDGPVGCLMCSVRVNTTGDDVDKLILQLNVTTSNGLFFHPARRFLYTETACIGEVDDPFNVAALKDAVTTAQKAMNREIWKSSRILPLEPCVPGATLSSWPSGASLKIRTWQ